MNNAYKLRKGRTTLTNHFYSITIKEALLAYTFLLKSEKGLSAQMLDEQIETWFKTKYKCELDFEISDALEKLTRMRLVTCTNNVYSAINLDHAKTILDERWDNLLQYN